jgi:hypothetical protein
MDQVEVSAVLRPLVPCFVLNMPADDASLDRLERALCHPDVAARQFVMLARSHFQWEPQWAGLSSVILGIARLADGAAIACRILCGRIQSKRINQHPIPDELLECARRVLIEFGFGSFEQGLDNDMATLARLAFSTDQNDPRLSVLIEHFFGSAGQPRADWFAFDELLTALFRLRPEECLDACFSGGADDAERSARVLHQLRRNFQELVPAETSLSWAGHDAAVRCPLLARAIKCFMPSPAGGEQWSDFALSVLSAAPNRRAVLDVYETHFIPSAFSTARSDILEGRRRLLSPFLAGDSLEEQAWAQALDALMAARAAKDRIHEAKEMTGFEY